MSGSALKGFFHCSDERLITPEERQRREWRQRVVSSVFYGYPPEVLSAWCCVSLETAKRWKSFESLPSPRAFRLFELHRDRKVLASTEWNGWLVKGDVLVDPAGNETTQAQLCAYHYVYQLVSDLASDSTEVRERLDELQCMAVRDAG